MEPDSKNAADPIGRALALLRPWRGAFLGRSILGLGALAAQLLLLTALRTTFDRVLAGEGMGAVLSSLACGGLLLFSIAVLFLLKWREPLLAARVESDFLGAMQGKLLSALLSRPSSFWAKEGSGEMVLRLTDDLRRLLSLARIFYGTLWLVPFRVAVFLGALFWIARPLFVSALFILPLGVLLLLFLGKGLRRRAEEERLARFEQSDYLLRTLAGAEILQALDSRRQVAEELARRGARATAEAARLSRLSALGLQGADLLRIAGVLAVLFVGQGAVVRGELSPSDLLTAVPLCFLLYGPLSELSGIFSRLAEARVGAERVVALLEESPGDIPSASASRDFGEIKFESVSFSYNGKAPVFESFSFAIRPAEWIALTGPSGAGKTTLLRLLLGAEHPKGGKILLGQDDATQSAWGKIRPLCALVTQEPLLPGRTVRENLLLAAPDAGEKELWESLEKANLAARVRSDPAGLDLDVGDLGSALSGGERERLAFARALLSGAPILLLDEPTAFLDPATRDALIQTLRAEKVKGRTILCVSHEEALVQAAERIVRL
ncbi:MAG: ABC transporter ATP-binding protein [Bdellovibrionota bacterium]